MGKVTIVHDLSGIKMVSTWGVGYPPVRLFITLTHCSGSPLIHQRFMKLRSFIQLPAIALLIVCLHSCAEEDASVEEANQDLTQEFALASRFNSEDLQLNPEGTASMPPNLTDLDVLIYSPDSEDLTLNNVDIPKSDGEADWVLRPKSSGALMIGTYRYYYGEDEDRNVVISSGDGGFPDGGIVQILETGVDRNGSWSSVRPNPSFTEASEVPLSTQQRDILRETINSLGFYAVDIPNAFVDPTVFIVTQEQDPPVFVNGVAGLNILLEKWLAVQRLVILGSRKITHTVTSTNEDILLSGEIRGTFELKDTYQNLYFYQSGETAGWVLTTNPNGRSTAGTATGIPVAIQPQEISPSASGTFVLKLGGLDTTNPNPGFNEDTKNAAE